MRRRAFPTRSGYSPDGDAPVARDDREPLARGRERDARRSGGGPERVEGDGAARDGEDRLARAEIDDARGAVVAAVDPVERGEPIVGLERLAGVVEHPDRGQPAVPGPELAPAHERAVERVQLGRHRSVVGRGVEDEELVVAREEDLAAPLALGDRPPRPELERLARGARLE